MAFEANLVETMQKLRLKANLGFEERKRRVKERDRTKKLTSVRSFGDPNEALAFRFAGLPTNVSEWFFFAIVDVARRK